MSSLYFPHFFLPSETIKPLFSTGFRGRLRGGIHYPRVLPHERDFTRCYNICYPSRDFNHLFFKNRPIISSFQFPIFSVFVFHSSQSSPFGFAQGPVTRPSRPSRPFVKSFLHRAIGHASGTTQAVGFVRFPVLPFAESGQPDQAAPDD